MDRVVMIYERGHSDIRAYHWRKLAAEIKFGADAMLQHISDLAGQVADHVSGVKRQMITEGLKHPIIPRLGEAVAKRAAASRKIIQRA